MVCQSEDCSPTYRLVGTDAFEGTGAVVDSVGQNMHVGFAPRYERAVHPDVFSGFHGLSLARTLPLLIRPKMLVVPLHDGIETFNPVLRLARA